jgi:hypothetical protein
MIWPMRALHAQLLGLASTEGLGLNLAFWHMG